MDSRKKGWIQTRLAACGALCGHLDSNPDSDSKQLDLDSDSDSRKKGWIRIQLDSNLRCLDSDPDSDSRCLDSHITDVDNKSHCLVLSTLRFWENPGVPVNISCQIHYTLSAKIIFTLGSVHYFVRFLQFEQRSDLL